MIFHGYFRSTASWRVRIALGLKGLDALQVSHHLRKGEQRAPDYVAINPQGLVPALVLDDGTILTQSLAIIHYLDRIAPEPPILPADAVLRAHVEAFALAIACDIHPVQNLKILDRVKQLAGAAASAEWARDIVADGLAACERLLPREPTPFAFGDHPSLADICLVPQLGNARRFQAEIPQRLLEIEASCLTLAAFADAVPERQPDAE